MDALDEVETGWLFRRTRYEAKAERFYNDTGYMAPGKDAPQGWLVATLALWDYWNKVNADNAKLQARVKELEEELAA